MVCSRHIRTCYSRPAIILEAWSCAAETVLYNLHINGKTHPTCQEDQPLSMRKPQVTLWTPKNWHHSAGDHLFLHLTPARTSLPPTLIALKELHASPGCTQSSSMMMQKPVIHAPHKCPIAMHPLVCEKLDEFLEQEIIVPVTEPTDWVSSLTYSWKANGKLWVCPRP